MLRPRHPRLVGTVALLALLIVGGAYGATTLLDSGGSGQQPAGGSEAWLGLQMESLPVDRVLVTAVVPGGPAAIAGVGPGDVITAIDNRPVSAPGDVTGEVAKLHPGDKVEIQIRRGLSTLTTQATLQAHPPGYP